MVAGIVFGVLVSLTLLIWRASKSPLRRMAYDAGTQVYVEADTHPDATTPDGVLVVKLNGPLFFADAAPFRSHLLDLVSATDATTVVVDLEATPEIDLDGADILTKVHGQLADRGVRAPAHARRCGRTRPAATRRDVRGHRRDELLRDRASRRLFGDVRTRRTRHQTRPVLTQGKDHIEAIVDGLATLGDRALVLRGGLGKKARAAFSDAITARTPDVGIALVATGSYHGEGFDWPELDALFLAFPLAFKGRVERRRRPTYWTSRGQASRRAPRLRRCTNRRPGSEHTKRQPGC